MGGRLGRGRLVPSGAAFRSTRCWCFLDEVCACAVRSGGLGPATAVGRGLWKVKKYGLGISDDVLMKCIRIIFKFLWSQSIFKLYVKYSMIC